MRRFYRGGAVETRVVNPRRSGPSLGQVGREAKTSFAASSEQAQTLVLAAFRVFARP